MRKTKTHWKLIGTRIAMDKKGKPYLIHRARPKRTTIDVTFTPWPEPNEFDENDPRATL